VQLPRVRVISRKALREFGLNHADARGPLDAWYRIVKGREYRTPHDVRRDFPTASFLGAHRTVFNVGGNRYRLVADLRYDLGRVYIRDILTHAEYDRRSNEGSLRAGGSPVTSTLLDFSKPHVLRSEAEYEAALAEIGGLLDAQVAEGTEGWDRLEFLSVLVEHYEDREVPEGPVTPQQAVAFMLEQKGLERSDLEPVMGGRSRVSEFLNGKRELSKSQIRGLQRILGIPTDILLGLHA